MGWKHGGGEGEVAAGRAAAVAVGQRVARRLGPGTPDDTEARKKERIARGILTGAKGGGLLGV